MVFMKRSLLSPIGLLVVLVLTWVSAAAEDAAPKPAPAPKPPGGAPVEIKTKGVPGQAAEPEKRQKSKKEREKKSGKEEKAEAGFDPKSFLLKLVLNADDDGDGVLSTTEFRKVPLLKELKKERIDSLFAEIDANTDAGLDAEEIGKGFGKITALVKDNRSLLDDKDAAKQAKKLKRLTR